MRQGKIRVSEEALQQIVKYDWPGNVRELGNAIEREIVLSANDLLEISDLSEHLQLEIPKSITPEQSYAHLSLQKAREIFEQGYIREVLQDGRNRVAEFPSETQEVRNRHKILHIQILTPLHNPIHERRKRPLHLRKGLFSAVRRTPPANLWTRVCRPSIKNCFIYITVMIPSRNFEARYARFRRFGSNRPQPAYRFGRSH